MAKHLPPAQAQAVYETLRLLGATHAEIHALLGDALGEVRPDIQPVNTPEPVNNAPESVQIRAKPRPKPTQARKKRALELARAGKTDAEIAQELGIHRSTLTQWKRRDREFLFRYIRARIQALYAAQSPSTDGGGSAPP